MGHSAKFGVYTMLYTTLMKVVHFEILQVSSLAKTMQCTWNYLFCRCSAHHHHILFHFEMWLFSNVMSMFDLLTIFCISFMQRLLFLYKHSSMRITISLSRALRRAGFVNQHIHFRLSQGHRKMD